MTSELMQFGWLKKGDRSSERKGDRHFDYKTGDRLSELLERAIAFPIFRKIEVMLLTIVTDVLLVRIHLLIARV